MQLADIKYIELCSLHDIDDILLYKILFILSYSNQTSNGKSPPIMRLEKKGSWGTRHSNRELEKIFDSVLRLLNSSHKRIERDKEVVFKTIDYFRLLKEYRIDREPTDELAPAAVFSYPGGRVKIGDAFIEGIAILPVGIADGSVRRRMGMKKILSNPGSFENMTEADVIELAKKLISNGSKCSIKEHEGVVFYSVLKEGDITYELKCHQNGSILDITELKPHRTILHEKHNLTLAESDKIAMIVNREVPIESTYNLNGGEWGRITKVMNIKDKSFATEVFMDRRSKDIFIVDVELSNVIVLDRTGKLKGFWKHINVSCFFDDLHFIYLSPFILENYNDAVGLRRPTNDEVVDLYPRITEYILSGHSLMTALILISWGDYYKEKGALTEGVPEEELEDYIVECIANNKKAHPGSVFEPVRFYLLRNEVVILLNGTKYFGSSIKMGFREIKGKDCWRQTNDERILCLLEETIRKYNAIKRGDKSSLFYIYVDNDDTYIVLIREGRIRSFFRAPSEDLKLYLDDICDLDSSYVLSSIVNGRSFNGISGKRKRALDEIRKLEHDNIIVYLDKKDGATLGVLYLVDWGNAVYVAISTEGEYMSHGKFEGKGYARISEIVGGMQDITKTVIKSRENNFLRELWWDRGYFAIDYSNVPSSDDEIYSFMGFSV